MPSSNTPILALDQRGELDASGLPDLGQGSYTQYLPAVHGDTTLDTDHEPVFTTPVPPSLDHLPLPTDVGFLMARNAERQFNDRFNRLPARAMSRQAQQRSLGRFLLTKLPDTIQDDIATAAEEISRQRALYDTALRSAYPATARLPLQHIAHELRTTARSIVYHALEPGLIRASAAEHAVRRTRQRIRIRLADLLHRQLPFSAYGPAEHLRHLIEPCPVSAGETPIPVDTRTSSPLGLLLPMPARDQMEIRFTAAMTLGPTTSQGPFVDKPGYPTLMAAMPASPPRLKRAPVTTPLKRARATKPLRPNVLQPPAITSPAPMSWTARITHGIFNTLHAYNSYGRILSSGLHPPPPRVFQAPVRTTGSTPRTTQTAGTPNATTPYRPRVQSGANWQASTSAASVRSALPRRLPGMTPDGSLTPRYARFVIAAPDGREETYVMSGTGRAFDERVRGWRIANPRARLTDQGPLKTYWAKNHRGNY